MTTPAVPQGPIPLKNLEGDSTPAHRIEKARDAQTIVSTLWDANRERNLEQSAYQGQINGNPPYHPSRMRAAGRAGDANFNTLEAKAICSTAMVPYYDLFAGGNNFVETALDIGDEWQATYASGVVTEEFDDTLKRWRNYLFVMSRMLRDFVVFGKGFLVWAKNGSWRLQHVSQFRVLVPDGTPIDLDELELFVVFNDYTVTYLMDAIRQSAEATRLGWDVQETRDAIQSAIPLDPATRNDSMAIQQQIRDADIYASARNSVVECASVFVKEFGGKWSELIVRRDQIGNRSQQNAVSGATKQQPRFLFKSFSKYDTVIECLAPFFFEPADADWPGSSGLGKDIFVPCQLSDRTWCSKVDSMFLRNSIIIQPRTETDRSKLNAMHLGKLTVLPAGVEAKDSTLLGDITSTIEVGQELTQMIEKNTGIYRPTLDKGGGNPDTLGEFQTKFAQATVLSSSAITRFYAQMDRCYEEMFRRLVKVGSTGSWDEKNDNKDDWKNEARRFVARCEARGVPKEWLERPKFVRCFRTIGQGSSAMRQQVSATFVSPNIFPMFPPDGQQNVLEDFVRSLGGNTAVNRYLPATSRMNLPNSHQWEAMIENGTMKSGATVTWTPKQNNIVHAETHLLAASQAIASLQQGANPMDVLAYVDHIGAHIAEHIQRESSNPMSQPAVKALSQRWKQLAGIADKLRAQIQATQEQQQELAQEQQQILTEADNRRLDIELKNQTSREKAAKTLDLKAKRQDAEIELKRQQLENQAAISDASNAADIGRKTAKTQAEIDATHAKAAASATNGSDNA